jgi:hypothetical protein
MVELDKRASGIKSTTCDYCLDTLIPNLQAGLGFIVCMSGSMKSTYIIKLLRNRITKRLPTCAVNTELTRATYVDTMISTMIDENYTDLTTPNIANVTIQDYEINNILYTSPYNYKIKIYDTFTNEETTISLKVDKVPTGVSVWTEYPDRVDYLAITRQGKQIYANIYSFNEAIIGIYNNKPLYRKMIDFGALNNTKGTKEVAHNIENIDIVTDVKITGYENEYAFPIPFVGTSHMFSSIDYTGRADKTNVYIYVSDDRSSQTAIVTLEYTKTSD